MRVDTKVIDDQDNKVSNRDESNNAGIFKRVESPEKAQGDDQEHESRDPKMAVNQVRYLVRVVFEAESHAWHKVADNYHV